MPKKERHPTKAHVTGKEKRQKPTKHYVFIVQVEWSEGSHVPIYRQYSDFHQLHTDLQEFVSIIPESETRITLPVFPAKKVFERAEISKAASVRKHAFDGYCTSILKHEILAKSKIISDFFLPKYDDINPLIVPEQQNTRRRSSLFQVLADLLPNSSQDKKANISKSRSSTDLSVVTEEAIYVSSPMILESFLVLADYTPQAKGEVLLKEDHLVQVVEKHANGWWFLSTEYGDGWGPATHLQSLDPGDPDEPDPIYQGSKYITTSSYTADDETKDELSFPEGAMIDVLHKLMDGWWVIKYQGQVGYAPATYLAPFKNPHYRDSRYGQKQNRRPTKRKSTIKNSKGHLIASSVRDNSRELIMYKKLSEKKTRDQAARIAAAVNTDVTKTKTNSNSVRFQDDVNKCDVMNGTDASSLQVGGDGDITSAGLKTQSMKQKEFRQNSADSSYEYIEDVNEWVEESVRKQKQEEEENRKHDYENVPKIIISDESDVVSPAQAFRTHSEPAGQSERVPQKAPAPPRRPSSLPNDHNIAGIKIVLNGSESVESRGDVTSSSCNVTYTDVTGTYASSSSSSSLSRQADDNDDDEIFEQPKEIDDLLTYIRKKKIHRIYTNDNGEVVIRFANQKDSAVFGTCDIRSTADTCPLDEPTTSQKSQTLPTLKGGSNYPNYSTVAKPKLVKSIVTDSKTDKQSTDTRKVVKQRVRVSLDKEAPIFV